MSVNTDTAAATEVPAAEEEKKHDVEYADEEAKGQVSEDPTFLKVSKATHARREQNDAQI